MALPIHAVDDHLWLETRLRQGTGRGALWRNNEENGAANTAVGNHVPNTTEHAIENDIEEAVSKVEINLNGPCTNMPFLRPQELKIIGRCVTFVGDTIVEGQHVPLHYEGVVGMVTKDTVMLLHVRRFTPEDFSKYQEKIKAEQENEKREKDSSGARKKGRQIHEGENAMDSSVPGDRADEGQGDNETNGCECALLESEDLPIVQSPTVELPLCRQGRQLGSGSIGPVPFMTILRRRIRSAVFGRDPPSTFYSIFQNSSKYLFDMQCLRMFVRRYLVHTSQGNNSHNIGLRSFIQWRCNCKNIDDELLIRVAREELTHLMKAERDMVKASERLTGNARNILRTYRPSDGIFRDTGILFLTRIPVQTFCLAILEMLLTILMLSFSAYSFTTADTLVVHGYVKNYAPHVTAAGITTLFGSGASAIHSLRMRLPLTFNIWGVARLVLVTVAIGLNTMVLVMVGDAVSLTSMRNYLLLIAVDSVELCAYYTLYKCRGFGELCTRESRSPLCMQDVCPIDANMPCTQQLSGSFIRVFIPMVVFSMVLITLLLIDHFLHYRLVQISRLLMSQV